MNRVGPILEDWGIRRNGSASLAVLTREKSY
jgi:hypothetical protein